MCPSGRIVRASVWELWRPFCKKSCVEYILSLLSAFFSIFFSFLTPIGRNRDAFLQHVVAGRTGWLDAQATRLPPPNSSPINNTGMEEREGGAGKVEEEEEKKKEKDWGEEAQ